MPKIFPTGQRKNEQEGGDKHYENAHRRLLSIREMSKTVGKSSPQTGKWEAKELGASQGRKNHSAVNPAPTKGMEKTDQAERRSCLAER